ncbi:helix-turn-helix domain-containing protein [Haploplasma axanthum]|uniref:Putative zinc finger/helix-turn-helix protein, YgiT family n=1 Tax=Haploplasma axanthum TaxID=29552 RepID=A0A449BC30_HAPAX|nr:helix-turn-helix domain-containing protein [Haploplasma axanthum]VEU79995.1 putative zinc finger/helix-turn-helix protein, YgiT family [Haploplasma axanthum]
MSKTKKINFDELRKKATSKLEVIDVDSIITSDSVKSIRNKLNMTQTSFADMLGVSVKTVEKWEQGKNPVKGTSSRLLFLIDKDDKVIDSFYKFTNPKKDKVSKIRKITNVFLHKETYEYTPSNHNFEQEKSCVNSQELVC